MSDQNNHHNQWQKLTNSAPKAVLLAAALIIFYRLLVVWEMIAIASLIALALRTILHGLQKIVKLRWLAVLLLIALIGGFLVFLALVIVPNLVQETETLLSTLPGYLDSLITLSQQWHQQVSFVPDLSQGLVQLRSFIYGIISTFPLLLRQTFGLTIQAIATLILAIYIAYEPDAVVRGFLRLVPHKHHRRIRKVIQATKVRIRGWLFGTAIAMLFLGVGATLGLWMLGIPMCLPFGVIAGLFEFIPYFGSIIGTLLPALVALTISPLKLIFVLVLFVVLNQVDAYIVQPLVMGRQVHLHPVMVIITFLIMGELLGFAGVILAVPTAAVVVTLVDEFMSKKPPQDSSGVYPPLPSADWQK
ncbi:MAG TPA: AI-2E family transporter [Waterburya sp.]|jgi:predicted PurR-regulated permease PerM